MTRINRSTKKHATTTYFGVIPCKEEVNKETGQVIFKYHKRNKAFKDEEVRKVIQDMEKHERYGVEYK